MDAYGSQATHQSVAFDPSGVATSLFFLKPSKSKCVFQCFTLGEKLYLRTRLYVMLFVLFSFLFFDLGSTPDSISSPHCSQPPSEELEKHVNLAETWRLSPLWPLILALKYLQYEHFHLTLSMFSLAEFALWNSLCFFLKRGFQPLRRISEKSEALDYGESTAGALGTFSRLSPTTWRDSLSPIKGTREASSLLQLFLALGKCHLQKL